jgi:2-methylcitrate dehydratase PrpD
MEQTQKLAKFCKETQFEGLPPEVVKIAKQTILDTLGCGIGTQSDEPEKPKIINKVVKAFKTPPEATVICGKFKAAAPVAGMANGVICHGIDFDDTHGEALTHTSAVIVPAALATAEEMKRSGKDFILSFLLGFEISVRVGMAVMPSHYEYWHSTATNCTFGAAAAAGKNYGFNEDLYINAFGFSGTQAAGLLTYLKFGDYTKSFNAGKSVFNGIFSALMAQAGGTAPPNMIENPKGYTGAYSKEPALQKLTRGLDEGPMVWEILNNMLKPFPSLAASHTPMDVTLRLVKENDIKPEDIVKIVNKTYNTVKTHFSNYEPKTVMAARLSVPYCVAVCAAKRDGGLDVFHPKTINDPVVQETLKKVEIVADPELNKLYPEKFPTNIEIHTKDGKVYKGEMYYAKGSAKNSFTDEEVNDKFRSLALPVMDKKRVEEIIQMVANLESVKDINEFARLLS